MVQTQTGCHSQLGDGYDLPGGQLSVANAFRMALTCLRATLHSGLDLPCGPVGLELPCGHTLTC